MFQFKKSELTITMIDGKEGGYYFTLEVLITKGLENFMKSTIYFEIDNEFNIDFFRTIENKQFNKINKGSEIKEAKKIIQYQFKKFYKDYVKEYMKNIIDFREKEDLFNLDYYDSYFCEKEKDKICAIYFTKLDKEKNVLADLDVNISEGFYSFLTVEGIEEGNIKLRFQMEEKQDINNLIKKSRKFKLKLLMKEEFI